MGSEKDFSVMGNEHRQWNDQMARRYNPDVYHRQSHYAIRNIEKRRVTAIIKFLGIHKLDLVLEIGCGAGNLIEAFTGGRIFGIDLSFELLKVAQKKNYKTDCHLLQSFGEAIPFRSNVFDKIYCSEVLEHVPDPRDICKEANRLLKQDGLFVISVPNEKFINLIKKALFWSRLDWLVNRFSNYKIAKNMADEWHLHEFNLQKIRDVTEDYFFIKKIDFIPSKRLPFRIVALCLKRKSN